MAHNDSAFTAFFRQTNHWAAGDIAITVPLSDGRSLWLFGDSYVDQLDAASGTLPCLFSARNAVLAQNTNDLAQAQTLCVPGSPAKTFFHPPGAGVTDPWPCFWPGAGFQLGNTVYIHLAEMDKTPEGGQWGFKNIGQYWAEMSFPDLRNIRYVELPSFNGISFGCGFVQEAKARHIYAYGVKQNSIHGDVYVARFSKKNPESKWTFWDGKRWNANVTNAAVITQGASFSVNVAKVGNRFVLVTTEFSVACDQGRDVYLSTAENPTGPFSARQKIYTVNDAVDGHYPFFYCPAIHPQFLNDEGLLITYSINGYEPCVPICKNGRVNPDDYRPRAIRLPWK